MPALELSDKQLTFIVLALERYAQELRQEEDDAGPSMADSLFVADLARKLKAIKESK